MCTVRKSQIFKTFLLNEVLRQSEKMCTENRDKLRIVINYDPPGLQIFTVAEKIRRHTCDNITNRRQFVRDKPDTVIICVTRIKTN